MRINIDIDLNHLEARLLQIGDVYDGIDTTNNTYLAEMVRTLLLQRAASNLRRTIDMAQQSRRPVLSPGPLAHATGPSVKPLVLTKAKTPKSNKKPIVWNNIPADE